MNSQTLIAYKGDKMHPILFIPAILVIIAIIMFARRGELTNLIGVFMMFSSAGLVLAFITISIDAKYTEPESFYSFKTKTHTILEVNEEVFILSGIKYANATKDNVMIKTNINPYGFEACCREVVLKSEMEDVK